MFGVHLSLELVNRLPATRPPVWCGARSARSMPFYQNKLKGPAQRTITCAATSLHTCSTAHSLIRSATWPGTGHRELTLSNNIVLCIFSPASIAVRAHRAIVIFPRNSLFCSHQDAREWPKRIESKTFGWARVARTHQPSNVCRAEVDDQEANAYNEPLAINILPPAPLHRRRHGQYLQGIIACATSRMRTPCWFKDRDSLTEPQCIDALISWPTYALVNQLKMHPDKRFFRSDLRVNNPNNRAAPTLRGCIVRRRCELTNRGWRVYLLVLLLEFVKMPAQQRL